MPSVSKRGLSGPRAERPVDRFTSSHSYTASGGEDGDNSSSGIDGNVSEQEPQLGTGRQDSAISETSGCSDAVLKLRDVKERFVSNTRIRLKKETQEAYLHELDRLNKCRRIDGLTKRQVSGQHGKDLIFDFLEPIPKKTWTWELAILKSIWINGFEVPWPIDRKRDIPRLPKTGRRETPDDSTVIQWHQAVSNEKDPYLRLIWLLISQFGWRPSHATRIKWRNVKFDSEGTPVSVWADGTEEGFKTDSPIVANIPPDVAKALIEVKEKYSGISTSGVILPWRGVDGEITPSRVNDTDSFRTHWIRLQKKWSLPCLRPVDMRHWVSTACRKVGLSKQASALMMGHDSTRGGAMRDWYDNPGNTAALQEQIEIIPNGLLSVLDPPKVEYYDDFPSGAVELLTSYFEGSLGTIDFAQQMEKIRVSYVRDAVTR